jgi:hypothetical protein
MLVVMVMFPAAASWSAAAEPARDESLRKGETRETLDPAKFKDPRVRKAYEIAKMIPWVLDSIHCFCFCDVSFQHKSVLSCYVDNHADG